MILSPECHRHDGSLLTLQSIKKTTPKQQGPSALNERFFADDGPVIDPMPDLLRRNLRSHCHSMPQRLESISRCSTHGAIEANRTAHSQFLKGITGQAKSAIQLLDRYESHAFESFPCVV